MAIDPLIRPASRSDGNGVWSALSLAGASCAPGRYALVVEDDRLIADVLTATLALSGFATRDLPGAAGLAEVLAPEPDIVVLDVSLQASDAVEVMKTLAAHCFQGEVLLVSGASPVLLDEILRVGRRRGLRMLSPLRKPFSPADILAIATQVAAAMPQPAFDPSLERGPAPPSVDCAEALRRDLLEVWYQPKCDARTGRAIGAECLVRVRHPDLGILLPGAFLPGAPPDVMADLTAFVLRQGCRDWRMFAAAGYPVRLAVNVPSGALLDMPMTMLLREICPKTPDWPGLILEITEEEACRDLDALHEAGTQVRIYGVDLSIDDFGLGYSNLSRLSDLTFREVKLDRSLVRDCHRDEKRGALCRAVVDLAHACGAAVVAEGVERPEELDYLARLGCDAVQGFLLGCPMPASEFVDWLCSSDRGVVAA